MDQRTACILGYAVAAAEGVEEAVGEGRGLPVIIDTEKGQIYHPGKHGFLYIDHSQDEVDRENREYRWIQPATAAHRWPNEHIDRLFTEILPTSSNTLRAEFDGAYRVPAPVCACCGECAFIDLVCVKPNRDPLKREYRCQRHRGRTPCVVEGCLRSTGISTTYFICAQHWKAYVPPGSPERRVLQRLTRLARKMGYAKTDTWPDELEGRWWRVWSSIAKRVQRRSTDGHIDQDEIERMFGWKEAPMK